MASNVLSIVLLTCNEYSDLWDGFIKCYKKYFADSPRLLMVADEGEFYDEHADFVTVGEGKTYSDRLRYALDNIDSDFVLLLLEDYYLSAPLKTSELLSECEYMRDNDIDYLQIVNRKKAKRNAERYTLIDTSRNYCVNLGANIWNVECLKSLNIEGGLTPWQVEVSLFTPQSLEKIHDPARVSKSVLRYEHIAQKGMVLKAARKFLKREGIKLSRKVMGFKAHAYYVIAPKIFSKLPKGIRAKLKNHYKKKGHKFYT